jgi:hypothetical protein
VNEDQLFEFKGNALIHFRVRLRPVSVSISTMRRKGGEAVKTWDVDFSRIETVRVAERRGARTRMSGLYLKPRGDDVVMFAWQKNAAGAPAGEANTYYAAAVATLRALAEQRPDLVATIGPFGRSALIGAVLGAIFFVVATYLLIGEINVIFGMTAAAIIAVYAVSSATSGAFRKTRRVSLSEVADELAANSQR